MSDVPERSSFTSNADGTEIHIYRWRGPADPRGLVVIAHGMGEHALRYHAFAQALNGAGFDVWALDHRGHGATGDGMPGGLGDFGGTDDVSGWDALVADLGQLIGRARERGRDAPMFLFGHSMGSFAAQQYCIDHSRGLDGVILSGSTAIDQILPAEGGEPVGLEAFNAPFEPARTPFDWLSRDESQVDAYIADDHCGFDASPEAMAGMAAAAQRLADPDQLRRIRSDLPVLLVAGDADPLNGELALLKLLEQRWRDAGVRRIDTCYYPGGRHEMLNETNAAEVTRDILSWLQRMAIR